MSITLLVQWWFPPSVSGVLSNVKSQDILILEMFSWIFSLKIFSHFVILFFYFRDFNYIYVGFLFLLVFCIYNFISNLLKLFYFIISNSFYWSHLYHLFPLLYFPQYILAIVPYILILIYILILVFLLFFPKFYQFKLLFF